DAQRLLRAKFPRGIPSHIILSITPILFGYDVDHAGGVSPPSLGSRVKFCASARLRRVMVCELRILWLEKRWGDGRSSRIDLNLCVLCASAQPRSPYAHLDPRTSAPPVGFSTVRPRFLAADRAPGGHGQCHAQGVFGQVAVSARQPDTGRSP